MYPERKEAERLLKEAEGLNPGPWGNHSRAVAHCAEEIAKRTGMDADKAYFENKMGMDIYMAVDNEHFLVAEGY